jgi:GGDEF domain-containing protein
MTEAKSFWPKAVVPLLVLKGIRLFNVAFTKPVHKRHPSMFEQKIATLKEHLEREEMAAMIFNRDVRRCEERNRQLQEEIDGLRAQAYVDPVTGCLTLLGAIEYLMGSALIVSRSKPTDDELRWVIVMVTLGGKSAPRDEEPLRAVANRLSLHFKRGGDAIARSGHRYFIFLAAANLDGVTRRVENELMPLLLPWAMAYDQRLDSISEAIVSILEMTLRQSAYDGGQYRLSSDVRQIFEGALKRAEREPLQEWRIANPCRT